MIVALSFLSECSLESFSVIRKISGCSHKAPKLFLFIHRNLVHYSNYFYSLSIYYQCHLHGQKGGPL